MNIGNGTTQPASGNTRQAEAQTRRPGMAGRLAPAKRGTPGRSKDLVLALAHALEPLAYELPCRMVHYINQPVDVITNLWVAWLSGQIS